MTLLELKSIIQKKYLIRGDFVLSSGQKARWYYDIKALMGNPEDAEILRQELEETIYEYEMQHEDWKGGIGGTELGGALIAASMVNTGMDDWSYCYIRKSQRLHGVKKMIEGYPVSPILLVDDVISSGDTLVDAAEEVVAAGFEIAGCLCVINRHTPVFDKFSCTYYGNKTVEFPIYSLFVDGDFNHD